MQNAKPVAMWEPKRTEKTTASGAVVPGEYVGKFRTKVPEGTPNARRHVGENPKGDKWDFWGLDVDSINGVTRWVDVRNTPFGPKIVLFLETDKRLNQITCDYDVRNIRDVMNHLCGLKKDLHTAHINVSYWVRKQMTGPDKKTVKTDDKGNPMWSRNLYFRDVPELFTFDAWKEYAAANDLEWFQEMRGGKKVWNFEAELNFWLGKVAGVQKYLIEKETALPFRWDSVVACPTGLLSEDDLAACQNLYESIKPLYRFPYSRTEVSADDVDLAPVPGAPAPQPAPARAAATPASDPFENVRAIIQGVDPRYAYSAEPEAPVGEDSEPLPF